MALADKLLDNISEEQFAEYMLVEENPHIVIDEDRNIILPERYKIIAAQGDHDMTTYTFDCPRFSDGRDMSKMVVYINYIRSDGETGSYPADNVSIDAQDNNLMHFEWRPLLPATLEHGAFAFLVCVCRTEPDGNMKNHWSTRLCKDATISEGMDCHKDTIINMYPDVITRILERLNVLEDGGTTSVQYTVQDLEEEQKVQARKNIEAADAKEVSKLSEDIATKASAIKEKASGELIIVNDSAEAKPLGLAIDGKSEQNQYSGVNMYDHSYRNSNNAIYSSAAGRATEENGVFKLNVTGSDACVWNVINLGIEYNAFTCGPLIEIPNDVTQLHVSLSNENFIKNFVTFYDENKKSLGFASYSANDFVIKRNGSAKYFSLRFGLDTSAVSGNYETTVMVNVGETALPYEPYCGGIPSPNPNYKQDIRNIGIYDEASGKYAVEVKCTGKNLFNAHKYNHVVTNSGVTYTMNEDGSYSRSGTATSDYGNVWLAGGYNIKPNDDDSNVILKLEKGKTYYIKDCVLFYFRADGSYNQSTGIITVDQDCKVTGVRNQLFTVGVTYNDIVCPMVTESNIEVDYEPYKETTATVYLDEPLRGIGEYKDTICQKDGVWGVERWINTKTIEGGMLSIYDNSPISHASLLDTNPIYGLKDYKHIGDSVISCVCDKYVAIPVNDRYKDKTVFINAYGTVIFANSDYDSLSEFVTAFNENPVKLLYTCQPTFTPFEDQTFLDGLSMFYPTTVVSNDCNANMEVEYIADTKAYIDKKFAELATAMV